jgi:hypothetical protein
MGHTSRRRTMIICGEVLAGHSVQACEVGGGAHHNWMICPQATERSCCPTLADIRRSGRVSDKKRSRLVLLVRAGKPARLRQMWAFRVGDPLIS